MTLTCPVCETSNEETRCRQCSTDLAPLARVTEYEQGRYQEARTMIRQAQISDAIEAALAGGSSGPSKPRRRR